MVPGCIAFVFVVKGAELPAHRSTLSIPERWMVEEEADLEALVRTGTVMQHTIQALPGFADLTRVLRRSKETRCVQEDDVAGDDKVQVLETDNGA